jgi:hypothetical protein
VAFLAQEGDREVIDGRGQVLRDGGKVWFQRVEDERLNLFHDAYEPIWLWSCFSVVVCTGWTMTGSYINNAMEERLETAARLMRPGCRG